VIISSVAVAAVFAHVRKPEVRLAAVLYGILFPLVFAYSEPGILPSYLAAPAVAPYFTFQIFAGKADGEFYADGMLIIAVFGYWILGCLVGAGLICYQMGRNRHHERFELGK
jgi:hypothetical protein